MSFADYDYGFNVDSFDNFDNSTIDEFDVASDAIDEMEAEYIAAPRKSSNRHTCRDGYRYKDEDDAYAFDEKLEKSREAEAIVAETVEIAETKIDAKPVNQKFDSIEPSAFAFYGNWAYQDDMFELPILSVAMNKLCRTKTKRSRKASIRTFRTVTFDRLNQHCLF